MEVHMNSRSELENEKWRILTELFSLEDRKETLNDREKELVRQLAWELVGIERLLRSLPF